MNKTLKPGIYLIYWQTGGHSIAAVGVMADGCNWIAPTNWIEPVAEKATIDTYGIKSSELSYLSLNTHKKIHTPITILL